MLSANSALIIQKTPHIFKCNISIKRGSSHAYRTMIPQVPQTKRVTMTRFS